ncbi:MAG: hypothetical protein SO133_07785 [Alloprevotella sp.]|nr:hypothetical protein [Alloprevotella sp.]
MKIVEYELLVNIPTIQVAIASSLCCNFAAEYGCFSWYGEKVFMVFNGKGRAIEPSPTSFPQQIVSLKQQ